MSAHAALRHVAHELTETLHAVRAEVVTDGAARPRVPGYNLAFRRAADGSAVAIELGEAYRPSLETTERMKAELRHILESGSYTALAFTEHDGRSIVVGVRPKRAADSTDHDDFPLSDIAREAETAHHNAELYEAP